MIILSLLVLISAFTEALSLNFLYQNSALMFLLFHLLSSALIVLGIESVKKHFYKYNNSIALLFFFFAFFIPLFGIISCLLMARWMYVSQKNYLIRPIHEVEEDDSLSPLRAQYGVGGLRIKLESPDVPLAGKISAFKTLSSIAPEKINNLLTNVLPDKEDELRMLAFYFLNKQEKGIIKEINSALQILDELTSQEKKAKLQKFIALQYWELIYRNLAEKNLLDFLLDQTLKYANLANEYLQDDPALWFLIGRVHHRLKERDQAIYAFEKAIEFGGSRIRILPYIAEIYFHQRKFSEIKSYIKLHSTLLITQAGKSLAEFWSNKHD